MGISIDEAINMLIIIENSTESLKTAIEIIQKYQKIEEIMNELNGDFYGSYLKDRQSLEKIYEVLKDGKTD